MGGGGTEKNFRDFGTYIFQKEGENLEHFSLSITEIFLPSYKNAHKTKPNLAIENNLICRIDLKSNYHVVKAT